LARTCPGRVDGSITERIAWSLSELIAQPDYYIDLHTGGTDMAILPMSGYMLHRDPEIFEVQRRQRSGDLYRAWRWRRVQSRGR
jgi:predicted deacylase